MAKYTKRRFYFLILVQLSSFPVLASLPHGPKTWRPWILESSLYVDYLNTTSNFNSNGEEQALTDGQSLSVLDVELGFRLPMSRSFALSVDSQLSRVESVTNLENRINTGVSWVKVGADYNLFRSFFDGSIGAEYKMPVFTFDTSTDDSLISSGEPSFYFEFMGQKRFGVTKNYFWLGYENRDNGLASLGHYGIGSRIYFGKASFALELKGFDTITKDQESGNPLVRTTLTDRVNAGSLHYYAVDPKLLSLNGTLGIRLSRGKRLDLGGHMPLQGINTSQGPSFFVGLAFDFDLVPRRKYEPNDSQKLNRFNEIVNDGVDQRLFREESLSEDLGDY